MLNHLKINKILWTISTLLTLVAAGIGVGSPHLYDGLFAIDFLPGAWAQDVLTVVVCLGALVLIATTKEQHYKKQIVILGILGSFFYLYGIFTIERVYNGLYVLYAAIFACSFWSLVFGLMNLKSDAPDSTELPVALARTSALTAVVIATLFTTLWISALVPLMRDHNRIEFLYSIYILDLCFVMPSFFVTGILTLRKTRHGLLLLPAIYITGFFVIFPLGLNEVAKAYLGQTANVGSMGISFVFSAVMLVLGLTHLTALRSSRG